MPEYLFAVQDQSGQRVASWQGDVARPADVVAVVDGDVEIQHDNEVVATGTIATDGDYSLHRWPVTGGVVSTTEEATPA